METINKQERQNFKGFIFRPDKKVLSFGEFDIKKNFSNFDHFYVNLDGEEFFVLCHKSQARNLYHHRNKDTHCNTFTPIVEEDLHACTNVQIQELIYNDDGNLIYKELYRKVTSENFLSEDYHAKEENFTL